MKRGQALLIALVMCASCLAPARAYANGGWWDWLEQLSGPGPFGNGTMYDTRLACLVKVKPESPHSTVGGFSTNWVPVWSHTGQTHALHCLTNSDDVIGSMEIRGGRIVSADKALFDDVPGEFVGEVTAKMVQIYFMRQLAPSLAVGSGAGRMWFTGKQVNANPSRFVMTPLSVAFTPVELFIPKTFTQGRAFTIRYEVIAFAGGLKAKDFNTGSTSSFNVKSELVQSLAMTIDVFALLHK